MSDDWTSFSINEIAEVIREFNDPKRKVTKSIDHPFVVEAERRFSRNSDGVVWLSTNDLREIIADVNDSDIDTEPFVTFRVGPGRYTAALGRKHYFVGTNGERIIVNPEGGVTVDGANLVNTTIISNNKEEK